MQRGLHGSELSQRWAGNGALGGAAAHPWAAGGPTAGHSHKKARYRLVNRVFGVDQKGIAAGLATLAGWAESFNTANDGHNGKATLVTKPGPVSTEQGTKEQFVSLTVVFAASATLLQYGGARLFACDAAHLK
jgi:hypothetical protein